jgi:predicted RND superfamily exporter protein
MTNGRKQLQGENYSRMLVYLNLPEGGDETYSFLDTVRSVAQSYYPGGRVLVVGNSTNAYDFKKSFARDNTVVSVVSILIVLVVLLFTFKSAGMPLLLILVIQGSIWVNFSFPTIQNSPLFFMSYLVVSSIQMGANIDYAIVIASRYNDLKDQMSHREAIIETMNFAFPTIVTSGTILAVSGFLIGMMTSEPTICGIGQCLGRGTVISIVLVMFVLPQILLLGAAIIEKTSFEMKGGLRQHSGAGRLVLDGVVSGHINGTVSGVIHATVDGDVDVRLINGTVKEASDHEE